MHLNLCLFEYLAPDKICIYIYWTNLAVLGIHWLLSYTEYYTVSTILEQKTPGFVPVALPQISCEI